MTFWSRNNAGPVQQHHFTVEFGQNWLPYEVKSITMPQVEVTEGAYRMGNHMYKYPGTQRWNDVTITIVDTGDAVHRLLLKLTEQGYYQPRNPSGGGGAHKKVRKWNSDTLVIRQNRTITEALTVQEEEEQTGGFLSFLGFKKKPASPKGPGFVMADPPSLGSRGWQYGWNSWYLQGAWIKSVNFGTHDYSSDELLTMEIVVAYDFAEVATKGADADTDWLYDPSTLDLGDLSPRQAKRKERQERRAARRQQRQTNRAARRAERDRPAIPADPNIED